MSMLYCDQCGRLHEDIITGDQLCDCGKDKLRMESASVAQLVAYETGALDRKNGYAYNPPRSSTERQYAQGYGRVVDSNEHEQRKELVNRGWY
jgi:hypothetical protein